MIVLMIGGKIAPSPSERARRSWIQASQASRAFFRRGVNPAASARFSHRSQRVKKSRQNRSRGPRATAWPSAFGTCNSEIRAYSGTGQKGFDAQMIESGTTMPRDQDDIL